MGGVCQVSFHSCFAVTKSGGSQSIASKIKGWFAQGFLLWKFSKNLQDFTKYHNMWRHRSLHDTPQQPAGACCGVCMVPPGGESVVFGSLLQEASWWRAGWRRHKGGVTVTVTVPVPVSHRFTNTC